MQNYTNRAFWFNLLNGWLQHYVYTLSQLSVTEKACTLADDVRGRQAYSATWHFGNVVWPLLSEPESVGLQINNQLLGRQQRCAAVQSGSFLWGEIGHKGYRASHGSCCLRWVYRPALCVCVAAADAWNGTQVARRASGLHCIFRQVITLLHWFFSLLHWSEKITRKRERNRRGKKQV